MGGAGCPGIPGRIKSVWVAGYYRYRWPDDPGIRKRQVGILETRKPQSLSTHLTRLRRIEVRISDTESIVYGAIFVVLLGLVVFNLWYATANLTITSGTIFSIVTYSWELVDAALAFPMALQGWSRLSEIMQRINHTVPSDFLKSQADQ
jgi:hypothetical protein